MRSHAIAIACCLVSTSAVAVTPAYARSVAQKVDEKAAQLLAAKGYSWPSKYMDYDRRENSFFLFAALGGEYGTAPVGWIGVNPWTGDVWDVWSCTKLSTDTLRKLQAAIRHRFRPGELWEYDRLRAVKPVCHGP